MECGATLSAAKSLGVSGFFPFAFDFDFFLPESESESESLVEEEAEDERKELSLILLLSLLLLLLEESESELEPRRFLDEDRFFLRSSISMSTSESESLPAVRDLERFFYARGDDQQNCQMRCMLNLYSHAYL